MKYLLFCPNCVAEYSIFEAELKPNNSGVYFDVPCNVGHKLNLRIHSPHFQVLFQNGVEALKAQYYFEAIACFAASYERFAEFFCKVVTLSKGIDLAVFTESWQTLRKKSERQVGAYAILYCNEFKETPPVLVDDFYTLRNDAIHNGKFPTKEICLKYGNEVLFLIRRSIARMKTVDAIKTELIRSLNYLNEQPSKKEEKKGNKKTQHFEQSTEPHRPTVNLIDHQFFAINRSELINDELRLEELLIKP